MVNDKVSVDVRFSRLLKNRKPLVGIDYLMAYAMTVAKMRLIYVNDVINKAPVEK